MVGHICRQIGYEPERSKLDDAAKDATSSAKIDGAPLPGTTPTERPELSACLMGASTDATKSSLQRFSTAARPSREAKALSTKLSFSSASARMYISMQSKR
jgi:hypothetical protein